MDEFLAGILKKSATEHQSRQSDASTNFLALLDRGFGKVYMEADPTEAAAIRQISHREAPINATPG